MLVHRVRAVHVFPHHFGPLISTQPKDSMRASRRFSTSRGIYPSGVNCFASDMVKPFATLLSFGILQAFHSVNYMLRIRYFTGFPFGIFRTRKHLQGQCFARQAESPAMPTTRSRTVIPDGGIRAFKRRQVKASATAATMPTDAEGNAGEISHAPATLRPMPRANGETAPDKVVASLTDNATSPKRQAYDEAPATRGVALSSAYPFDMEGD